jgi:hypothetical protein
MIALGIIEQFFIRDRIRVAGDAAATLANLQKMEMLWRAGIAMELLMMLLGVPLTAVLYFLLRPVHRQLAQLALLFGMVCIAVQSAHSLKLVEALFPIGTNAYLTTFTIGQLQAMTALAMKAHLFGFGIALLLGGPFFFITGYLIYTSGYFPKPIGVLYQLAGLGYIFNGFVLVLAPQLAGVAFMIMAAPVLLGEGSFAVWLLFKGVRMERWRTAAGASATVA